MTEDDARRFELAIKQAFANPGGYVTIPSNILIAITKAVEEDEMRKRKINIEVNSDRPLPRKAVPKLRRNRRRS